MSLFRDGEDALIDNMADRVINDFVPGNGVLQTGIDQFANNEINRELGGGLGLGGGYGNNGGFGNGGAGGFF